jgi:AcrR family transcriptional regulator
MSHDEPAPRSRPASILAGAAEIFGRQGFAGTSMREVATQTGMSLGAIYHHFENKEALLRAILAENFERVRASIEAKLEGVTSPVEMLRAFVSNHVAFFAAHLHEMRVMSHELDTLTGPAAQEVAALRRRYAERATGILRALRPDLDREEIRIASLCLFGMLNWTYRWFHTLPKGTDPQRIADRMADIFLNGFAGVAEK